MPLKVEALEGRDLASVTAVLSQGVLQVTGDNSANAITVRYASGTLRVSTSTNQTWAFPVGSVSRIEADLLGGNDNWNGLATGTKIPQVVHGGDGDDAITTGEGNDTVYGDAGNDSLIPWAGTDVVYGGAGNDGIYLTNGDGGSFGYPADRAYGGAGNDNITGGSNDAIYGEDGNDTLTAAAIGAYGATYMDGGNGDDLFYAREGQYRARDTIIGGAGYDRVVTFDSRGPGDVYEYFPPNSGIEKIG